MRIFIPLLIALASIPLLGFSCQSGAVSTCEAQIRLQCEFAFRCCDDDERIENELSGPSYTNSEAECIERNLPICRAFFGQIDDAIALGRVQFNQENANACIEARTAARDECSRNISDDAEEACENLFEGLVDDGDACASSNECADGGSCDLSDPDQNEELGANEGECVAPLKAGDDCTNADAECGPDLFCNGTTCQKLPGKRDACPDFVCQDGLFCNATGECEDQKDDGDDCDSSEECESFDCEEGVCGGDEICTGR